MADLSSVVNPDGSAPLSDLLAALRKRLSPPVGGELGVDPDSFMAGANRLGDLVAQTWNAQPSWLDRARQQGAQDIEAYKTGGPRQMIMGGIDPAIDLLGGFVGSTTPAKGGLGIGGALMGAERGAAGVAGGRLAADAVPSGEVAAVKGIRAYHGSPHDFDQFDLAKIGTGEGAQAYGHGLYFAENPTVAGAYKLTGSNGTLIERIASQYLTDNGGDAAVAAAKLREEAGKLGSNAHRKAADLLDANAKLPGHMYEVNIKADPEAFLDWDKPLGQQPVAAQDALSNSIVNYAVKKNEPASDYLRRQDVTEAVRQAGIPGIKYLDQGSRGAGDGTRNYVVFDPKIIDIIRKYGLAGLAGPLGGLLMQSNQDRGM